MNLKLFMKQVRHLTKCLRKVKNCKRRIGFIFFNDLIISGQFAFNNCFLLFEVNVTTFHAQYLINNIFQLFICHMLLLFHMIIRASNPEFPGYRTYYPMYEYRTWLNITFNTFSIFLLKSVIALRFVCLPPAVCLYSNSRICTGIDM